MASTPTTAVVVLTGGDLAELPEQLRRIIENQESLMADFAVLRAALEEQKIELVAAVDRVASDVQALQDRIAQLELDTDDQAEVDGLAAQVQESINTLRGIDPVQAVDDTENPPTDENPPPVPVDENPPA